MPLSFGSPVSVISFSFISTSSAVFVALPPPLKNKNKLDLTKENQAAHINPYGTEIETNSALVNRHYFCGFSMIFL